MAHRRFFSRDPPHHARLATTAMTHRLASPLRLAANRRVSLIHRPSSLCTSTRGGPAAARITREGVPGAAILGHGKHGLDGVAPVGGGARRCRSAVEGSAVGGISDGIISRCASGRSLVGGRLPERETLSVSLQRMTCGPLRGRGPGSRRLSETPALASLPSIG